MSDLVTDLEKPRRNQRESVAERAVLSHFSAGGRIQFIVVNHECIKNTQAKIFMCQRQLRTLSSIVDSIQKRSETYSICALWDFSSKQVSYVAKH